VSSGTGILRDTGSPTMLASRWLILALMLAPAACAYQPGSFDNPVARRASWFSYVAADDIRGGCAAGAPDRVRMVYNAVYEEQVRAYDLVVDGDGRGGTFEARVLGAGEIVSIDPLDPTAPWRGAKSIQRLDQEQISALWRALDASGFNRPAPEGTLLSSRGFYWIAAACRQGRFHFNAWLHPSPRFSDLTFPQVLASHDRTGVPFNPPREVLAIVPSWPNEGRADFDLRVGRDGLPGRMTLF